MSLTKQCHLYSIDTSAFYDIQEQYQHDKLVKLYVTRAKPEMGKFKPTINRIIKRRKEKLTAILDNKLQDTEPRTLNPSVFKDKNVISLFESSLTRAMGIDTNSLTQDLIVVNVFFFQVFENLIKNGFLFNGEKYVFLSASAGQIRTKRSMFIKESVYNQISGRLMCGLTIDAINNAGGINPNKYNAYLSLNNSATDVWEDFDIDKSIVVDDFETNVPGQVDFVDDTDYSITRKDMDVPVPHMDGCGIMLDRPTRMVRMPWVKGLLVYFPYDKFIQEKCQDGQQIVTDIYGQEHDIVKEDIRYIFTKSQFKLAKYYSSWEDYKTKFKENHCEACYCNIEEDKIPSARINYQMLQTLSDMTNDEIRRLTKRSIKEIETIGTDYRTTMRLLGATPYNKNPSWIQQALMIYPELFRDSYSKDILKQTKKSLVKQVRGGRLRVNGGYRFLSPDLYAFCEWLFLGNMNPKGLLENGEVYCEGFKDEDELACLRSPHLYREWAVRQNRRNEELDKWFGDTKCIYTSCHDLISKYLMFD